MRNIMDMYCQTAALFAVSGVFIRTALLSSCQVPQLEICVASEGEGQLAGWVNRDRRYARPVSQSVMSSDHSRDSRTR